MQGTVQQQHVRSTVRTILSATNAGGAVAVNALQQQRQQRPGTARLAKRRRQHHSVGVAHCADSKAGRDK